MPVKHSLYNQIRIIIGEINKKMMDIKMVTLSLNRYGPLIRFFEKQVEWLGLPRNTGLVLMTLYFTKYTTDEKLSIDKICEITRYSRSNVGFILSQLEALGLVDSHADLTQSGRGRRRILYSIDDNSKSPVILGAKKMIDKLNGLVETIDSLIELYREDDPDIVSMMNDLKEDSKKSLIKLSEKSA